MCPSGNTNANENEAGEWSSVLSFEIESPCSLHSQNEVRDLSRLAVLRETHKIDELWTPFSWGLFGYRNKKRVNICFAWIGYGSISSDVWLTLNCIQTIFFLLLQHSKLPIVQDQIDFADFPKCVRKSIRRWCSECSNHAARRANKIERQQQFRLGCSGVADTAQAVCPPIDYYVECDYPVHRVVAGWASKIEREQQFRLGCSGVADTAKGVCLCIDYYVGNIHRVVFSWTNKIVRQ